MINPLAEYDAVQHALYEYPKESVGVVIDGKYESRENKSSDIDRFNIDLFKDNEYPKRIDALIHSHPLGDPAPSASDMRSQLSMAIPWGIIPILQDGVKAGETVWFGDQCGMAPLIGRCTRLLFLGSRLLLERIKYQPTYLSSLCWLA